MSLIPAFEIGVWNAWIFMSSFILQMLAVLLLGLANAFWVHIESRVEERYCLERYNKDYREYINRTPRWLGLPKSEKT